MYNIKTNCQGHKKENKKESKISNNNFLKIHPVNVSETCISPYTPLGLERVNTVYYECVL